MNFTITNSGAISAIIDGTAYAIAIDHPCYDKALKAIKRGNGNKFVELIDIGAKISKISNNKIAFILGSLYYNREKINGIEKINEKIARGASVKEIKPIILFLCKLVQNPSKIVIETLSQFVFDKNLTITNDGCFLAYKRVRANFKDIYTGKINNKIGHTIKMKRQLVNDDPDVACAAGLNIGSIDYALFYANSDKNPIVIVKVNPKNVVCIPDKSDKCRVCEYKVTSLYKGNMSK